MFRYEIGATILVRRYAEPSYEPITVEILAHAPHSIMVKVLSGGWFTVGSTHMLTDDQWYSMGRIKGVKDGELKNNRIEVQK